MAICFNTETFKKVEDLFIFLTKIGTCIENEEESEMNIKNGIVLGKVFKKYPIVRHEGLDDCLVIELKKVCPKKCFIEDEKIFRLISGGLIAHQINSIEINAFVAVYRPEVIYIGKSRNQSLEVSPSRSLVWCIPELAEPDLEYTLIEINNLKEEHKDIQAATTICPASSSSQTYYDSDGNIENGQLVASQISQLTQRFSLSEYNNSPVLIFQKVAGCITNQTQLFFSKLQ